MTEITNAISQFFVNDPNDCGAILAYIDFNIIDTIDEKYINLYVNNLIQNNPILKSAIVEVNDKYFFRNMEEFNTSNCFSIKYILHDEFDNYISPLINKNFTEIYFFLLFCIDEENKKMRMYFKIHHSYVDGYKLIEMLTNAFNTMPNESNNVPYVLPAFNRTHSRIYSIYFYIIGTFALIFKFIGILYNINIGCVKNIFFSKNKNKNKTDFIIFESLDINDIKHVSKKNNITINDFLYSLLVKTDKLYNKTDRFIYTCCPVNVSKLSDGNNMVPMVNKVSNSLSNIELFSEVHKTFNYMKYSLFVPLFSLFIDFLLLFINSKYLYSICKFASNSIDYIFTNMIGPNKSSWTNTQLNVTDLHFLIKHNVCEIIYNIISIDDKINITLSFQEGIIQNKPRFKKCLQKAYNELIQ